MRGSAIPCVVLGLVLWRTYLLERLKANSKVLQAHRWVVEESYQSSVRLVAVRRYNA